MQRSLSCRGQGNSLPDLASMNTNAESGEQVLDKHGCLETNKLDPVPEDHLEEAPSPFGRKMKLMLDVKNIKKKRVSCLSGSNGKRQISRMDSNSKHELDMLSLNSQD